MTVNSIFALFIGANSLLLVALAFYISSLRIKHKISTGDGGNSQLFKAIRTHANGVEQVPIFSFVLLTLIYLGSDFTFVVVLALGFTLARLLHAYGMLFRAHKGRQIGAAITYLLQVVGAIAVVIGALH